MLAVFVARVCSALKTVDLPWSTGKGNSNKNRCQLKNKEKQRLHQISDSYRDGLLTYSMEQSSF
jgi:hypothetical protein